MVMQKKRHQYFYSRGIFPRYLWHFYGRNYFVQYCDYCSIGDYVISIRYSETYVLILPFYCYALMRSGQCTNTILKYNIFSSTIQYCNSIQLTLHLCCRHNNERQIKTMPTCNLRCQQRELMRLPQLLANSMIWKICVLSIKLLETY